MHGLKSGKKYGCIITLDETYFYLEYCNGKEKLLIPTPIKSVRKLLNQNEMKLSKINLLRRGGWGVIGRGKLPFTKVPSNLKMNIHYYIEKVLVLYFE